MLFGMDRNRFLVLLLVSSLALKIPLALSVSSFGVDESLYLATARHFAETGDFGLKSDEYDFRFIAPVFPFLLSIFYSIGGENGALLVSPVFSSLTIIAIYFLGQRAGGEKTGRMAALVGFFASVLLLLASRPLTESTALFFFTVSLVLTYDMFYSKKTGLSNLALPSLVLLTFLTRFQYGALAAAVFLVCLVLSGGYRQLISRKFLLGCAAAALLLSPWALLNIENYSTPLGGAAHQAGTDIGFNPSSAVFYVPYSILIIGLFLPFVAYGKYVAFKERNTFLLASLSTIFIFQFFVFGKIVEERYALPILPVASVIAALGFYGFRKRFGKIASLAMVSLMLVSAVAGYGAYAMYQGYERYNETKAGVMFMKGNCSPPVMSNSFAHVWNYWGTGIENVPIQPDLYKSLERAGERFVTCIMFSGYEYPNMDPFYGTPYVERIFNIGKVSVYRLKV